MHTQREVLSKKPPNARDRVAMTRPVRIIMVSAYTNWIGRLQMVEEIIGRLPELTGSQLGRLEDELRRERQRRAPSASGEQDAPRVEEYAALPLTEVLEYRPYEDGYLQLELRRYIRRDGSARKRGPYWYPRRFAWYDPARQPRASGCRRGSPRRDPENLGSQPLGLTQLRPLSVLDGRWQRGMASQP
jgi:hypothetical protein